MLKKNEINEILPDEPDLCKVCWQVSNDTEVEGMAMLLSRLMKRHRKVLVIYSNMASWIPEFTRPYLRKRGVDFEFRDVVLYNSYLHKNCDINITHNGEKVSPCKLIEDDLNHFKGWFCQARKLCLSVRTNGDIYAGRCGSELLGTLKDSANIRLRNTPNICPYETCEYPLDVSTHKWHYNFTGVSETWTGNPPL